LEGIAQIKLLLLAFVLRVCPSSELIPTSLQRDPQLDFDAQEVAFYLSK
jgi:hypothetical protein